MKRVTLCTCLAIGLTLGATPAMAEEINTKEQFLAQIAGKKLVQKDNWVILSPDGTVRGEGPAKGTISGNWTWEGTYYCREITVDGTSFPRDCQTVTLNGDTVNFIHEKGKGITISWRVE